MRSSAVVKNWRTFISRNWKRRLPGLQALHNHANTWPTAAMATPARDCSDPLINWPKATRGTMLARAQKRNQIRLNSSGPLIFTKTLLQPLAARTGLEKIEAAERSA